MKTRLNEQTGIMLLIYCMFLLVMLIVYFYYRIKQRGRLNSGSIKEAVDTLPMAVCYFLPSGMVKLCNKQMEILFHFLTNTDLQYYSELVQALENCGKKTSVKKLEEEKDTFLFPDGRAWYYSERIIKTKDAKTYTEVLFTDVTSLYNKGTELKKQAKQLHKLALNLKELSDNVLIIARENEILTAKTKLHNQMGSGTIAIRQFLLHGKKHEEVDAVLQPLRRAISMIKYDAEEEGGNELTELIHDARVIGVKVRLKIETKKWKEVKYVIILAIRECLTNAARHADATILKCSIKEEDKCIVLIVTNNGKVPTKDIKPKGGLKNLLRIVNNFGGSMRILSKPSFKLTIRIPYEK